VPSWPRLFSLLSLPYACHARGLEPSTCDIFQGKAPAYLTTPDLAWIRRRFPSSPLAWKASKILPLRLSLSLALSLSLSSLSLSLSPLSHSLSLSVSSQRSLSRATPLANQESRRSGRASCRVSGPPLPPPPTTCLRAHPPSTLVSWRAGAPCSPWGPAGDGARSS